MPFPFYGAPWRGTPAKGRLRCPCPPHPFPAVKSLSSYSCPSLSLSVVFLFPFLFLTNIFSPFFCYNFLLFPPLSATLLPLSAQHQRKCVKGVTSFVLRNTGSRDELKDSVPQEHASSVFREVVVVSFRELFLEALRTLYSVFLLVFLLLHEKSNTTLHTPSKPEY